VDFVIGGSTKGSAVVTAEDVAAGKPAPNPYLAAATALGVTGDRCVVFEDTPVGIAAGHAAGARVVGLATTLPREAISAADLVIDDFDGLAPAEVIDRLMAIDGGRGR
jgi:sugar-phosphatase